jgi:hypothetical protein
MKMRIDDAGFEKLLTAALHRAAELDYEDAISDEELALAVQPSQRFQRKMKNLLRNPPRHIRNQRRPIYLKMLRSAAAVFVAVTVLFGAVMAASPTVRAAVVNFVRTWLEDRTIYETPDRDMYGDWTFGYIPEGFVLIEEFDTEAHFIHIYQNDDSISISITISSGKQVVDNEHSVFYETTINGNAADIYESNNPEYPNVIVMYYETTGVVITLVSEIDVSQLIRIAENIR